MQDHGTTAVRFLQLLLRLRYLAGSKWVPINRFNFIAFTDTELCSMLADVHCQHCITPQDVVHTSLQIPKE